MSVLHTAAAAVERWCRRHLASRAPGFLIDPDGEGGYWLDPDLWQIAAEYGLFTDHGIPDFRALDLNGLWMRRNGEDTWTASAWRGRDTLKFPRWQPAFYTYITPKGDS